MKTTVGTLNANARLIKPSERIAAEQSDSWTKTWKRMKTMFVEMTIVLPIIAISCIAAGVVFGKWHERVAWNNKMATKNITPETWKNIPYQHGG